MVAWRDIKYYYYCYPSSVVPFTNDLANWNLSILCPPSFHLLPILIFAFVQMAENLMTIAYENGVNLFDTAEVYASGRSDSTFSSTTP